MKPLTFYTIQSALPDEIQTCNKYIPLFI